MKSLLAQEYLRELHVVRQVSQHTIAAYTKDLDYLLARLDEQKLELILGCKAPLSGSSLKKYCKNVICLERFLFVAGQS
ncbi:MAG: hypothetical protein RJA32_615 [Pseudomonadota bacterium]